ncbi:hypothetical protein D3C74_382660 [compost metagenome]
MLSLLDPYPSEIGYKILSHFLLENTTEVRRVDIDLHRYSLKGDVFGILALDDGAGLLGIALRSLDLRVVIL